MNQTVTRLLKIALLSGVAYVLFAVPFGGRTVAERVSTLATDNMDKAKNSVQIDDGRSAFPHADETLTPRSEGNAPSTRNRQGARMNQQIQDAAKRREQRMQQKQDSWK